MRLYYALSRLASPFIAVAFYVYSFLVRTPRARLVLRNDSGEVLLLQTWPDTSKWALPGGGLHAEEKPEEAAVRELREETGMEMRPEEMILCFSLKDHGHQELVFRATTEKSRLPSKLPNEWEVRSAAWFSPESLPKMSPATRGVISQVVDGR